MIPSAAFAAEGIFFQPSTAGRCLADFESAVNPEIQFPFKKKLFALRFHFVKFGLNLYNGVMYFGKETLYSEWIKCEFQGVFLYGGFKIR